MERIKRKNAGSDVEQYFLLPSVIGGVIGVGVVLLLVLLMPFALLGFGEPNALILPSVCFCAVLGNGVGCFAAISKSRGAPLRAALVSTAILLLPMVLISFFVSGEGSIGLVIALLLSLVFGGGVVLLFLTKSTKSKKKKMKSIMKRR